MRVDHIGLSPLRDPNDNRLRELWIESGTYWTDAALISRNFDDVVITFEAAPPVRQTALDTFLFVDPYLKPMHTLREP